jgi:hypothetical protein
MKYPECIVNLYKESLVKGSDVTIDDVEEECAYYESESGANMDPSFESDWYEDLYNQVEETNNVKESAVCE